MPTRTKDSYSIQSVDNALDVLEALCEEGDDTRISELSAKLGMNKTSVFRLLATFEKRGYVEKEPGSGKYRLGLSAYEIGQKFLSRMGLLRNARPIMERLVRETNEAVYLTVRRGDEVLFLDVVDTAHQVKIISLAGKRYPLGSTAAGKLFLTEDLLLREKAGHSDRARPPYLSEDEMAALKRWGVLYDRDTLGEGITSIAVPLFNALEEIPGCLCLVGPDFRLSRHEIEQQLVPRMKEAGEIVSSKLGYHGHYLTQ